MILKWTLKDLKIWGLNTIRKTLNNFLLIVRIPNSRNKPNSSPIPNYLFRPACEQTHPKNFNSINTWGRESIAPLATTNISVVICHKQPNWSWQFACATRSNVSKRSWPLLTQTFCQGSLSRCLDSWTYP